MNILYCFLKRGYEGDIWTREIGAAVGSAYRFVPFNYHAYLDPQRYWRAQLLDNLYYDRDPALMRLYQDFESLIEQERADAIVADTIIPFHPDYLRRLSVFKVIRVADGPISAYDRDIPYLHAYDHVLYHSPAYSADLSMAEKLAYCRVRSMSFWPMGLFDAAWDTTQTEDTILAHPRDIDVVFIGAMHIGKMPELARIKRALGRRCHIYGQTSLKRNAYMLVRHRYPGWIRPVPSSEYVPLYQRSKIGFNLHNRGKYTVGSLRLFELPANGVMQISDGGEYLQDFFDVGREIEAYESIDELIDKIRFYLAHDAEREAIARQGFRRAIEQYRMGPHLARAAEFIAAAMARNRVEAHNGNVD